MFLIIDNYDSFVYNLATYLQELEQEVLIYKNDQISISQIAELKPSGIIISPGPQTPTQAGISLATINAYNNKIPILGVCLGHQAIGQACGAKIEKGKQPYHGKVTLIQNNGQKLFYQLPTIYKVTRYHSLVIKPHSLPPDWQIDATSDDGAIMAISHQISPTFGVQFHPEALLTEYGHELLRNFINIANTWRSQHD